MNSFFVTLPSTASMDVYPENTQSHYKVQLPHAVELAGAWSVALAEIQLPSVWMNINESFDRLIMHLKPKMERAEVEVWDIPLKTFDQCIRIALPEPYKLAFEFTMATTVNEQGVSMAKATLLVLPGYTIRFPDSWMKLLNWQADASGRLNHGLHTSTAQFLHEAFVNLRLEGPIPITVERPLEASSIEIRLAHGHYASLKQLLIALERHISANLSLPEGKAFGFKILHNQKVELQIHDACELEFPKKAHGLGLLLGFSDKQIGTPLTGRVIGEYTADVKKGVFGFYIYTDLIKHQLCGDVQAPLLRIVHLSENPDHKQSYVQIYDSPDYYPLQTNRFETVEILICTDYGEPVKFLSGKTVVKLRFKKIE